VRGSTERADSNIVNADGEALSRFLRPRRASSVLLTLGLRLQRLEVLGVNSRLDSLNPAFGTPVLFAPRRICSILIAVSRVAAISAVQQPSQKATVLTFERRDTACRGQNPP
jgi:hypothetical protein